MRAKNQQKIVTDEIAYSEPYEQATERLRMTLSFLAQRHLAPNPFNYRIGYDYTAGKDVELKEAVDNLVPLNGVIPNETLTDLYQRHFIQTDEALETLRGELYRIIQNIKNEFRQGSSTLSSYLGSLEQFSDLLQKPANPVTQSEVDKVIKKTRTTQHQQHGLASSLSYVMSEIDELRKELTQVKEESLIDSLTNISNRKAFDSYVEDMVHQTRETKNPFSLLLIDIDRFKQFNDTYGHLIGDKVLRFVASTLKRSVKGKDFVARFGGEEFAVVLPMTKVSGAMTVAGEIRQAISSGQLTDKSTNQGYGQINVSIGITEFRLSDLPNELIQRADRALYLAKERGRNRVEKIA